MYEKAFQLEIITPSKVVFKGEATSLSAPGVQGNFQVLYDHAPFLSALEVGTIKMKEPSGNDVLYATSGGFVEVNHNHVVLLADAAEKASEIDVDRARAAKERAEERLQQKQDHIDRARAEAALARAVNRLHISKKL